MEQTYGHCLTPNDLSKAFGITVQGIYRILKTNDIKIFSTKNKRNFIPPSEVRNLFLKKGIKYPKLNISFQIVKGGVGKTSLSLSLAVRASHYGARVLAIDFDQQSNLTRSFCVDSRDKFVWLNIIRDDVPIKKAIINVSENLDLIPSNLNNSRLDNELTQSASNLKDMVKDKLSDIRNDYDLIIMDCPPALNKINASITCGSDLILIPINPDPYSIDGLDFSISEMEKIKKEFKLKFDWRILWNRYDARERIGAIYMHKIFLDKKKVEKVFPVVIGTDITLKNAVFNSQTIFEVKKNARIKEDIDNFAREILDINEEKFKSRTKKDISHERVGKIKKKSKELA
jgi:chromosome partitioning protein